MINDYMSLGGIEVINTARLKAYLESVGSPFDSGSQICGCTQLGPTQLQPDGLPYTTPSGSGGGSVAPWYDVDVPESANFLGFLPLSIDGLDDNPVKRSITTAVTGGGAIGPARVQPRTITVTGLLLGVTCCAVNYGLLWLSSALQGCTGNACGGDCMEMLDCCPADPSTDYETFQAEHRRTFRRVTLVDGPAITARHGNGTCSGSCGKGADILTVEFTLVAATPWAYTDQTELLNVDLPASPDECIVWDVGGGDCGLAECTDPVSACVDPLCSYPAPPQPTTPLSCFCYALAEDSACYTIDLSTRPNWATDVPIVSIYAGSSELRNVRIALYERRGIFDDSSCADIAGASRCEPVAEWNVGYMPASSELTLDGQVERAMLFCGGTCETAQSVWGFDGAAITWPSLDCARYCLCIFVSGMTPPAADAQLIFSVSGKGL